MALPIRSPTGPFSDWGTSPLLPARTEESPTHWQRGLGAISHPVADDPSHSSSGRVRVTRPADMHFHSERPPPAADGPSHPRPAGRSQSLGQPPERSLSACTLMEREADPPPSSPPSLSTLCSLYFLYSLFLCLSLSLSLSHTHTHLGGDAGADVTNLSLSHTSHSLSHLTLSVSHTPRRRCRRRCH